LELGIHRLRKQHMNFRQEADTAIGTLLCGEVHT
jgi:hypothetical protein